LRPYGDPIRKAIASGDVARMRGLVGTTRRWLIQNERQVADVRRALSRLERAIRKLDH
jgi:hypothetical protein